MNELSRILSEKFEFPAKNISDIEAFLSQQMIVSTPSQPVDVSVRDKDDLWVLSEALMSEAECLVTGDDDLLVLSKVQTMVILNPRQLWTQLNRVKE